MYPGRSGRFFGILMMALSVFLLAGAVVMLLWNAILPEITGVKPLQFPQALGLLLLSRLLFGSFRFAPMGARHAARKAWREKWMQMNETERAEFRQAWKQRCARGNPNS
ncbi:MAG: hypothetical protein KGS48_00115 [Bacteroidetes bacterium]|nr:hypothetical protein [Bacteroidota bacterium]